MPEEKNYQEKPNRPPEITTSEFLRAGALLSSLPADFGIDEEIFQYEEFDSSEILTEELIKDGNFAHKVRPWMY